jgi:Tfp pilus assembly protein FimT
MGVHMTQTQKVKKSVRQRETGVSLLELMITLGIGMVLVAMATPLVNTTINIYRLRGAGTDYANLLQQTRMRAVSNDRYYPVYASTTLGTVAGWAGFNAFADINLQGGATGAYAIAPLGPDLGVAFNHASIILQPRAAAPAVVNLENGYMPGVNPLAVVINPNDAWATPGVAVVSFGPRGLPCSLAAAPPVGGGGNCSYTVLNPGGPQPVAFETFMRNINTGAWESITVNPSGRIREWRYNVANATWQPLN